MKVVQGIEQKHMQILTRVWNYNEMKGYVDGVGYDDNEDDAKASKIQVATVMDFSASSSSRTITEVRFMCFVVAL
jgi:hypothetical protein